MEKVKIVDFEIGNKAHQNAFKQINYDWIEKYFKVEKSDTESLENPEIYFINRGGAIVLAEKDGEFLGTAALKSMGNKSYELCKMGVLESARGHGLGELIAKAAIEKAKQLNAKRVYLETNSSLSPAISLYKKLGFEQIENFTSPYERADVAMEVHL